MTHPFTIGGIYENRNGIYEAVRIDEKQDRILIRYVDTGEEIESTITTQSRIWQNMQWERQEVERQQVAVEAGYQKGYGRDFTGLYDSDFKTNTEGTTWRSRAGLAGRVSQLLSADTPYTFVSWAIYGWPVAFLTHREDYEMAAFAMGVRKAKFTIELDEENAYCGLYVEKNAGVMDHTWDWPQLFSALQNKPELQVAITSAEKTNGVRFLGRTSTEEAPFHFADGLASGAHSLWDEENPSAWPVAERLQRLASIPPDEWGEIYLMATIAKDKAIENGVHVAHTIATALRVLLPLYTAAIQREENPQMGE